MFQKGQVQGQSVCNATQWISVEKQTVCVNHWIPFYLVDCITRPLNVQLRPDYKDSSKNYVTSYLWLILGLGWGKIQII